GRLRRGGSIAFPPSIRTGAAYRQQLRRSALCMVRDFKTPQIFGTWTANVQSPGFDCCRLDANGEPSAVWDDIPKFVCAYSREWDRVWTYIRRSWAEMVLGGLVAWFWVTEFQDRGVPHVHFVLWTKWRIDELLEANRSGDRRRQIISTSSAPIQDLPNRQLQQMRGRPVPLDLDLVNKVASLQMHQCRDDYCLKTDSGQARTKCRFNFPRPACPTTRLDEHGRYEYARTQLDSHVNPYNLDLLRFAGSTIDLQFNQGGAAQIGIRKMNLVGRYATRASKYNHFRPRLGCSFNNLLEPAMACRICSEGRWFCMIVDTSVGELDLILAIIHLQRRPVGHMHEAFTVNPALASGRN
ncbi:hypothetical protein KVV02_005864, partial [Mortierella alpina]